MCDRGEDLSELRLIGGTIKLTERPSSSSISSVSKRQYYSRLFSRPASAIPRLCSGDQMQDDLSSLKNGQRPYSADFVMPNLLSGKSKETLTDGSFESIYVPVDFRLPSSHLFKELLEEDIEEWQRSDIKSSHSSNTSKIDRQDETSIPIIIVDEIANTEMQQNNSVQTHEGNNNPVKDSIENVKIERQVSGNNNENSQRGNGNECPSENQNSFPNHRRKDSVPTREENSEEKYILAPGLTSKPPLPKKLTQPSTSSDTGNRPHDNAIYDYFAIKYNLESGDTNAFTGEAEKPICEGIEGGDDAKGVVKELPPEKRYLAEENIIVETAQGTNEITSQCIKTVEVFEERKRDDEFDLNLTLNDWLKEINYNTVQLKESETDKYIKEIKQQCKSTDIDALQTEEIPLLSEIDLDDLFNFEKEKTADQFGQYKQISNVSPPLSPKRTSKESQKKRVSRKTTKSKSPASRKSPPTKIPAEKGVMNNNRMLKENKTYSKGKFIAMPIKLDKTGYSPHENVGMIDANIETWIGKDVGTSKKKRAEFSDLINEVDDLRSTTEILCKDIPTSARPASEDGKQENFDDLENIIEALEYQDKTSHNSIQTMKKIVSTELSNSIILNESEENLAFKKSKQNTAESLRLEIPSKTPDSMNPKNNKDDSEITSPIESFLESQRSNIDAKSSGRSSSSKPHTHNTDSHEITQKVNKHRYTDDLHTGGDYLNTPGCNGQHNYKELLSYLDEVDKKCTRTLEVAKERAQTASKLVLESSNLFDTMPKVEDLLTHTPEELASFIIDLSLRVKDKTSCIALLQNELSALREKVLTQSKHAEANLRQKLKEQKEETERIAKRHQKFIDQLMEEKKTLARRCEELAEEMTTMEDKYVSNMKAIEHKHQVELQKVKDMQAASEKLRRERWIEGRTQKIKEMAVKSIEPEVERMEKRHQEELSNLRGVHKREIEELELRATRKLQEHSENLREQLIQDREKALAHERDVMRLRYEKLVESEERNYQEQRRRLLADHSNRIAECEEREAQAAAEKERAIKQAQEEFEEKLQAAARRNANEIKLVKETAAIEMENWKNSFRKQQSALLMEKETSIRRECRKERDREIEIVIERLENEANKAKTQLEQTSENRIKRIKDKYEAEIRDLEMLEKDAQNKYCEARSKLLEYEDVILTLRTSVKQLESQLTEEKLRRSRLESEREEIRQTIRTEYEDKMHSLESEVERLRTSADKQVEQLYSRVRVSLARKDELLAELTHDHRALKEKCAYLENMMEQQRKEFMINS